MRTLRKYWGWAFLVLLIGAIANRWFGPPGLLVISAACVFYFAFQVPTWCMANNRDGTLCRKNSKGLFFGCSIRQHKWQKIKLAFVSDHWRKLGSALKEQPLEGLKTVTTLLALLGGVITLTVAIVKVVTPV